MFFSLFCSGGEKADLIEPAVMGPGHTFLNSVSV